MSGAINMRQLITLVRGKDLELYTWLRDGLEQYKAGTPLDRALGISGPVAVEARDSALRHAAKLLDPDNCMSTWALARKLAEYLERSPRGDKELKEALRIIGKESKYSRGLRSVRRIYDVLKAQETTNLLDLMPAPPEETKRDDEHDKQIKLSI